MGEGGHGGSKPLEMSEGPEGQNGKQRATASDTAEFRLAGTSPPLGGVPRHSRAYAPQPWSVPSPPGFSCFEDVSVWVTGRILTPADC